MKGFLSYIHILKLMEKECDECSQKLKDSAELAIHLRERAPKDVLWCMQKGNSIVRKS